MIEVTTIDALRAWRQEQRRANLRVGLVPTMGYLHEGHLRLVDRARDSCDRVVMSVFVNPAQFGPHEDFDRYPRDLDHDRRAATDRGVDCVFVPDVEEIYPVRPAVSVTADDLTRFLCGPRRPGHFAGVLLVVLKLFHIVEPDVAVFGRKDAQQALLIQRMVRDLNVPVTIDVAPTVREPDGLAMSSRNAYLSADERRAAGVLSRALEAGHRAFAAGARSPSSVLEAAQTVIEAEPMFALEYLELVDRDTLAPPDVASATDILAVAGRIGTTRLIDNVPLGEGLAADVFIDR